MKSLFLIFLVCSLSLFGCATKPVTVVGSWRLATPGGPGDSTTYIFEPTGAYTYAQHAAFESIRSHQSASGKYQFSGGILTLNTESESMGIDADVIAAIDAREKQQDPTMHIPQDKGDVPIKIEQPTTSFKVTFKDGGNSAVFKDLTNYADHGVVYVRAEQGN